MITMSVGEVGLAEEDQYLLGIDLDDLDHSTGEDQAIWLLALKAAILGKRSRSERKEQTQQCREATKRAAYFYSPAATGCNGFK